MTSIVVLGAGRVGAEVARDLSTSFDVTAVDAEADTLRPLGDLPRVETVCADASSPGVVRELVDACDVVVGALPGSLGFQTLRTVIDAGKDVVDIAFAEEDPFELDELAKDRGVTAVVDCGVAPGMNNLLLAHEARRLRVDHFSCVVGGLPVERTWPFEYKAPFSPADVIEEYTRPARYRVNGMTLARAALSEPTLHQFDGIGTLEGFLTDGLRTLLRTQDVPNMEDRTLRYPGHARLMRALGDAGFFDRRPIDVGGKPVAPRDFTAALLFPQWTFQEGERDVTVMRVAIAGWSEDGDVAAITWELHDEATDGVLSMARTTGYPCAAAVHLLASGRFSRIGICPPEYLARDDACFEHVLAYQRERGVEYRRTVKGGGA